MECLPVPRIPLVDVVFFELEPRRSREIFRSPMYGQRQYRLRVAGVEVAVFHPAVTDEDEVARPALCRRRGGGECQSQFVSGVHDHVAILDLLEQYADVTKPSVVADKIAPARDRTRELTVDRRLRCVPAIELRSRKSTVPQVSAGGRES